LVQKGDLAGDIVKRMLHFLIEEFITQSAWNYRSGGLIGLAAVRSHFKIFESTIENCIQLTL
jgi:hypothetical protein